MPQKKPPVDDWQDITPQQDDWQNVNDWEDVPPEKGLLQQYNESWVNQPLSDRLTYNGQKIFDPHAAADYWDPVAGRTEDQWKIPNWVGAPFRAVGLDAIDPSGGSVRSLLAGGLEGSGEFLRQSTTPQNLALLGAGSVYGRAAKAATTLPGLTEAAYTTAPRLANVARRTTQALSIPQLASAGAKISEGVRKGSAQDIFFGTTEAAMGAAGLMTPKIHGAYPTSGHLQDIGENKGASGPPEAGRGRSVDRYNELLDKEEKGTLTFSEQAEIRRLDTELGMKQYEPLPHTVVLKKPTPAIVADLRQKGYVSGGLDENGYAKMVRSDLAQPPTQRPPTSEPPSSSIFGENEINFTENGELIMPRPSAVAIKRLQDQGYEMVHVSDDGSVAVFRPISEQEMRVPVTNQQMGPPREPPVVPPEPTQPLPHDIQPDISQQNQPVPELGPEAYTPQFAPQRGALQNIGNEIPSAEEMRVPINFDEMSGHGSVTATAQDMIRKAGGDFLKAEMNATSNRQLHDFNSTHDQYWSRVGDEIRRLGQSDIPSTQEMRVPGVREGKIFEGVTHRPGTLENVAMGGANPRTLDVLGSSLYSRSRPVTAIKELLQNAFDEHRIAGVTDPVRVHIENIDKNPRTQADSRSLTVRDRGRGMTPDQLYKEFTDIGETGKAGIESASGGFGFAKASPFLGGKYAEVDSVVDTPSGRMKYSFEGTPSELKNQAKGVPLNATKVGKEVPTGLQVKVYYDKDVSGFYEVSNFAKNMTERSPSVTSKLILSDGYSSRPQHVQEFLNENPQAPVSKYNTIGQNADTFSPEPVPKLQDSMEIPGSKINIHYDDPASAGQETSEYAMHMTNKGLYQGTDTGSYGSQVSNVPHSIVADIVATVEEGHEDYPFSANREQLNDKVKYAIKNWINKNIVSGVQAKRVQEIQRKYDQVQEFHPSGVSNIHWLDEGNRLTPDELQYFQDSPEFTTATRALEDVHKQILDVADTLGWTPVAYNAKWRLPSERLKKFGLLFAGPDPIKGSVTMGIHIPRPDDMENSAILINLMEHLNQANASANPVDKLITSLMTTIMHEQAHIPGGSHDQGHSYRDADLHSKMGAIDTTDIFNQLRSAFSDVTNPDQFNPEISNLLSIYNDSRGRPGSSDDALIKTGIASERPTSTETGEGADTTSTDTSGTEPTTGRQLYELSRGALATGDISATFRQALPMIGTRAWRKSWAPMARAIGDEGAYQEVMQNIKNDPMALPRFDTATNKVKPSFIQEAGLAITDLKKGLSNREESQRSTWLEKIGLVRASNRAYNAFLNNLRFETFKSLTEDAKKQFDAGAEGARNPYRDMVFAKEIADYVNTATGRGPLKIAGPTIEGGRVKLHEYSLEQNAKALTNTMFAPRLMASRARLLNPMTYVMASPFVRRQYINAALRTATAWSTFAGLAWGAGADVSLDPDSADFGKIKIGNTRIDPAAGFQQYLVAFARFVSGRYTSSASGQESELGQGYRAQTRGEVVQNFLANKAHPTLKFGYDMLFASKYRPVNVMDRIAQMYVPLIVQDMIDVVKDDPSLLPIVGGAAAIGMGTQTYERGETKNMIIPPEMDWNFQGGAPNLWE